MGHQGKRSTGNITLKRTHHDLLLSVVRPEAKLLKLRDQGPLKLLLSRCRRTPLPHHRGV